MITELICGKVFGSRGSPVQIRPPRPITSISYLTSTSNTNPQIHTKLTHAVLGQLGNSRNQTGSCDFKHFAMAAKAVEPAASRKTVPSEISGPSQRYWFLSRHPGDSWDELGQKARRRRGRARKE